MTGLNTSFNIARSSMLTVQRQINTTGNNIANSGRIGYHAQSTTTTNNYSIHETNGQYGTGTYVVDVVRSYDTAMEKQLQQTISLDGYNQTHAEQLSFLEQSLAPDGVSNLTERMQEFSKAWQAVSSEPESNEQRYNLMKQGELLATQVNLDRKKMTSQRDSIADGSGNGEIYTKSSKINSLTKEIAALNQRIDQVENWTYDNPTANNLRDNRDILVNNLAELVNITVIEEANHSYTIEVGSDTLVSAASSNDVQIGIVAGSPQLQWASDSSAVSGIDSGEIKGLIDSYDFITQQITELDTFTTQLTTLANSAHTTGYDLDGNAGGNLFDNSTPGDLKFIITDPSKFAASNSTTNSGNGDNSLAIWQALNNPVAGLNNNTLVNDRDRAIDRIAIDVMAIQTAAEGSAAGISMYQNAIQDKSGVNMDEEMLNMLNLERAFQASAKFMNIIDDLVGTVINLI